MFKLNIVNNNIASSSAYIIASVDEWHGRLGHINFRIMKNMSNDGLIDKYNDEHKKCVICSQSKITRKPFKHVERESTLLQLVHSDICDLSNTMTRGGKYYFITFIDDCSRYTYVYLLRTKDEALSKFKIYVTEVENKLNRKVVTFRSDRGGEYTSKDFFRLL